MSRFISLLVTIALISLGAINVFGQANTLAIETQVRNGNDVVVSIVNSSPCMPEVSEFWTLEVWGSEGWRLVTDQTPIQYQDFSLDKFQRLVWQNRFVGLSDGVYRLKGGTTMVSDGSCTTAYTHVETPLFVVGNPGPVILGSTAAIYGAVVRPGAIDIHMVSPHRTRLLVYQKMGDQGDGLGRLIGMYNVDVVVDYILPSVEGGTTVSLDTTKFNSRWPEVVVHVLDLETGISMSPAYKWQATIVQGDKK